MKINFLCQLQRKDIGKIIQSLSFYTIKCVILRDKMAQMILPFGANCGMIYRILNYGSIHIVLQIICINVVDNVYFRMASH